MVELRIALIDSNETVRAGRAMLINSQPDMKLVFEESDPSRALERAPEYLVDVLVTSVKQHGFPGLTFVQKMAETLNAAGNSAAMLVTSPFSSTEMRSQSVLSGASDLVSLEEDGQVFLRKVRQVSKRDFLVEEDFLKILAENFDSFEVNREMANNFEQLDSSQKAIIANFNEGLSDFENAKRLDVSKLRVTQLLTQLMQAGALRTRNQLAIAVRRLSK